MSFSDHEHVSRANVNRSVVLGLILALMATVFIFDILTPPDDVTICFIYALLIFLTLFSHDRSVYLCAAIATVLSALGSFINPPTEAHSVVFFANRGIAVVTQWTVAFLVLSRKASEARMRRDVSEQRDKAETSRRFLDMLSHEIGTSLTRIDGQAFLLRKNAQEQKPADIVTRADKVRDAVRHIHAIVRQIQLGSEAGERMLDMTPVAVDLRTLVADVVLGASAGSVSVETDLARLPATIWGDPDMLRQVLDNVLSNAVKYSHPDGIVRIEGESEGGGIVLSVMDRGRGIPPEELPRIFTPYYRARNSRGVHGAGLGLYVARRFVESHGGTIEVESTLDIGTAVRIRLPVQPTSSAEEIRVAPAHPLH